MKQKLLFISISSVLLSACMTDPYTGQPTISNTMKGGGIGAAVGAGAGTLFGGNDLKNAAFGALAGGLLALRWVLIWIASSSKWNSHCREPASKCKERRKTR